MSERPAWLIIEERVPKVVMRQLDPERVRLARRLIRAIVERHTGEHPGNLRSTRQSTYLPGKW